MTVYAELLKLALMEGSYGDSLDDLIADVVAGWEAVSRGGDGSSRLAAALAYDAALVRLCERVGVEQQLTGESPGPDARRRAEAGLAAQLPTLELMLR